MSETKDSVSGWWLLEESMNIWGPKTLQKMGCSSTVIEYIYIYIDD